MTANFSAWETPYGFKWGPVTVERMADFPQGLVMSLKTDSGREFQIYVSAKGKSVRIHEGSVEWKPSPASDSRDRGCEVCASTGAIVCTADHEPYR